jgi:hypothetical protein
MTVSNAVYDATVYLKFSELLDDTHSIYFAHDLIIKDFNSMPLIAILDYTTTATGDTVVITFPNTVLPLGEGEEKYTIETKESIVYIRDKAGNKSKPFDKMEIKNP